VRVAAAFLVAAAAAAAQEGPAARIAAFRRHADARSEEGLPALREGLKDGDPGVRRAAIAALGRYGRPGLLPLLAEQARDGDPRFAGDAVRAMSGCGWDAMPHLAEGLTHCVNTVAEAALGEMRAVSGVRADAALLAGAWNASRGDRIRFLAAVLASGGDPRALGDALRALGERREAASVEVLLGAESEGALEEMRLAALARATGLPARDAAGWRAWGEANRGRTALEWLQAALVGAKDAAERAAAARALADESDPRAAEYVVLYGFRDREPRVREAAWGALRGRAALPYDPAAPAEKDVEAWLAEVRARR
jgi:hypothetical protein